MKGAGPVRMEGGALPEETTVAEVMQRFVREAEAALGRLGGVTAQ